MKNPPEGLKAIEVLAIDEPKKQQFLTLHRLEMRNHYPDGSISKNYFCETTLRRNLDAVAVILYERDARRAVQVLLRRQLRPALVVRQVMTERPTPGMVELKSDPVLLEVVAGLLEPQDRGSGGVENRTLEEIWEEAGYRLTVKDLTRLGAPILPTPGINPEEIHLFAADVSGQQHHRPPGDGSALEDIGGLIKMPLAQAIAACEAGRIRDAKTEICLHRLRALVNQA